MDISICMRRLSISSGGFIVDNRLNDIYRNDSFVAIINKRAIISYRMQTSTGKYIMHKLK